MFEEFYFIDLFFFFSHHHIALKSQKFFSSNTISIHERILILTLDTLLYFYSIWHIRLNTVDDDGIQALICTTSTLLFFFFSFLLLFFFLLPNNNMTTHVFISIVVLLYIDWIDTKTCIR